MKSIFLGLWFFYIALFGENVFAQEHEVSKFIIESFDSKLYLLQNRNDNL